MSAVRGGNSCRAWSAIRRSSRTSTPAPTAPPTSGTALPNRCRPLRPIWLSSRKPTPLLTIISAGPGSRSAARLASRPAGATPALLQQVVRVGADQGQQDGRAHLGLAQVVAAQAGDRGDHPRGQQVELSDVDRQRDRQGDEPAEAGDEATGRRELRCWRTTASIASSGLGVGRSRLVGHQLGRVDRPASVDAEVEQPLDDPGGRGRQTVAGRAGRSRCRASGRPAPAGSRRPPLRPPGRCNSIMPDVEPERRDGTRTSGAAQPQAHGVTGSQLGRPVAAAPVEGSDRRVAPGDRVVGEHHDRLAGRRQLHRTADQTLGRPLALISSLAAAAPSRRSPLRSLAAATVHDCALSCSTAAEDSASKCGPSRAAQRDDAVRSDGQEPGAAPPGRSRATPRARRPTGRTSPGSSGGGPSAARTSYEREPRTAGRRCRRGPRGRCAGRPPVAPGATPPRPAGPPELRRRPAGRRHRPGRALRSGRRSTRSRPAPRGRPACISSRAARRRLATSRLASAADPRSAAPDRPTPQADSPGRPTVLHRRAAGPARGPRAGAQSSAAQSSVDRFSADTNRTRRPGRRSAGGSSREIPQPGRRVPDELPPAGRGSWVDGGVARGQGHRAGGHPGARRRSARHDQPRVAAGEVDEPRREPGEGDPPGLPAVALGPPRPPSGR